LIWFKSVDFSRIRPVPKHHNVFLREIRLIGVLTVLTVQSTSITPTTAPTIQQQTSTATLTYTALVFSYYRAHFSPEILGTTKFNQRFQIGTQLEFNGMEQGWFCQNMEGYTDNFVGHDDE
jgi:hypothetical protein